MTKLQKTMKALDTQAVESGDASAFWQSASLLLTMWSSGYVPAAGYGPQVAPALYAAAKKLGADLLIAVNARAFSI